MEAQSAEQLAQSFADQVKTDILKHLEKVAPENRKAAVPMLFSTAATKRAKKFWDGRKQVARDIKLMLGISRFEQLKFSI